MYDKITHTNVWQKHAYKNAYKCMTKTRIQMYEKKHAYKHAYKWMTKTRIQMCEKNQTYKHAYKCMTKTRIKMYEKNILIYWSGGLPITAPREYGVPCSMVPQPWQGGELPHLQVSAHQSFCWAVSGNWTANSLVIGRPHSPLRHGQPKYKCKNVWQKHAYKIAYKCMTKTRIQMYKKNTHSNEWQKHAFKIAYKCMRKTRIQMYEKNTHTNV